MQEKKMSTIDPSFRNLIQFVPQRLKGEDKSSKDKPHHSAKEESGEDVKNFYETLVNENSSSQNDLSADNYNLESNDFEHETESSRTHTRGSDHESGQVTGSASTHSFKRKSAIGKRKLNTISNTDTTSKNSPENKGKPSSVASSITDLNLNQRQHFKLLQAAQLGNLEQISSLLKQGLDVNFRDFYGWTPLMCAAKEGHIKVVSSLLVGGADFTACNSNGQTAVMLAKASGHTAVVEEISNFLYPRLTSDDSDTSETVSSTYYCQICKSEFLSTERKGHETSTVHLFNTGRKPKGPSYLIPETNRGFQMLLKTGWEVDKGLGPTGEGHKYPVKTVLKHDRKGLGGEDNSKKKAKVTHFNPNDKAAIVHNRNIPERKVSARKAAQYSIKARERKEKRREQRLRMELSDGFH